jgi:hypothetical protein
MFVRYSYINLTIYGLSLNAYILTFGYMNKISHNRATSEKRNIPSGLDQCAA